ncbi:transposase family protein [Sinomicrobium oceani]|uniref:transposase family protein n=1 Tax=Sinomicrobium oceani TaxID=1150368 RepID=UPI00373FD04F
MGYTPSKVVLYAHVKTKGSSCPQCTAYSKRVHSHYIRQATDLPILEYKTCLLQKTRKFICTNPKCPQKVFSEQTPGIERYSIRTKRVDTVLSRFSLETSAKQACILSEQMVI